MSKPRTAAACGFTQLVRVRDLRAVAIALHSHGDMAPPVSPARSVPDRRVAVARAARPPARPAWTRAWRAAIALVAAFVVVLADPIVADACGCLSPPAVTEGEFAVNQRAEQIIFEVEPGWVTAHVLIKYAGDPEQFAWIVPVPGGARARRSRRCRRSASSIRLTAPDVAVSVENICPTSAWACRYHAQPIAAATTATTTGISVPPMPARPPTPAPASRHRSPCSTSRSSATTRRSRSARARPQAATQWLRDNGFIVNPTTSIYMESYVQANMVFVAAKLVPGAGIDAIKPLRMRYRARVPDDPARAHGGRRRAAPDRDRVRLRRAAVPADGPPGRHARSRAGSRRDPRGRLNYPMVLARDDRRGRR